MSASDARAVFERYVAAVNARDADALHDVLHADFQDLYPQSGELTRGAENVKGRGLCCGALRALGTSPSAPIG